MILFVRKLFRYLAVVFTIVVILFYLVKPKWNVGQEVQQCIDLINYTDNFDNIDTFRLGDSVGKNLIGTNKDKHTLNGGSNQAITILGQILLFNKFYSKLEKDKKIEFEGYIRPSSFYSGLNQIYTFNYFLKYFYNEDWFFDDDILSNISQKKINDIFLKQFRLREVIRITYWNGFSIFTYPKFGNELVSFEIKSENILDIVEGNDSYNFRSLIHFKPMPVNKKFYKGEFELYEKLKNLGYNIEKPFIINDSFFRDDCIHLKNEFRNFQFYKKITKNLTTQNFQVKLNL
jgi:hypothetical protein